ncbi:pilus assembly protein CpaD [Paracoccus sp. Z118]|uniref:flavin-dependent monooxygenase QhpG n=1 Tax=Paracoccus sp. Z118 TaxID=2851017 RepID=UPI001C2B7A06|nr:pilus assembly protein CpaD [Paracoccus sp. Z118]MBV0892796.1 pilus assembly protein CpaD [Paracoccus sp. Z118]
MTMQADLVVMGGGPAGTISAWLAAQDGRRVILIDPDRAPSRIEGLSPRLQNWLHRAGLLPHASVPLVRVPRRSLWAGTAYEGNHELLVSRPDLDRHLRDCAREAGATVVLDTATPAPGGARMGSGGCVEAPLVLDARGRRAAGRDGTRRGPPTVAMGVWLDGPAETPPQTLIVPLDDGWVWFACMGSGRAWAQVTLNAADPDKAPPPKRVARALADCTEQLPGFRPSGDATVARECSPVLSPVPDDLSVLPVGDAAAAMDPLSGHGMFWAVSSAIAAAAVRRTLTADTDGSGRSLAGRFLGQRTEDVFLRQARIGRDFIRAETARASLPFWKARAAFPDDEPAHPTVPAITTRRQVVVKDGRLTELEVLISPRSPGGVGWFHDLPAADLWRAHAKGEDAVRLAQRFGPAAARFPTWLAEEATPG